MTSKDYTIVSTALAKGISSEDQEYFADLLAHEFAKNDPDFDREAFMASIDNV